MKQFLFIKQFQVNLNLSLVLLSLYLCPFSSASADLFPFQAPKNFSIFMDKDLVDHPVTTSKPEAQHYFNQGFTLIYAFNHDAAYWSFQKAAEIDPEMPMAYWGMALALGSNINMSITPDRRRVAYQLIQKALQYSSQATENEKAYIWALAIRYSNDPNANLAQLDYNYFKAMEKVKDYFKDDLDAATLYAESGLDLNPWSQWDENGNPKKGTLPLVEVLESVLKRAPNHLGANHYYIHAIEASNYPERALMSAERLRYLLPDSGHILHMPGHIYILVGDYHTAAICNEEAIAADRAYIQKFGMRGIYPLHYMSHNLYFLSRSYSMEGRLEDALRAGNDLHNFITPHLEEMPDLEYYIPTSLFVLLRFHQWQDVLSQPLAPQQMLITNVLGHFARATAFASLGDLAQAQKEQTLFEKGKSQIPADATYGYNKAETIMKIADFSLKAKLAEAQKDIPSAIQYLKQAIAVQDKMHYNEPPDWFFPIRESLGGLLLRDQQFQAAEQVFRQDLDKHPRNGRALFGLLESLKAQSQQANAYWIQKEFEQAWRYSTVSLNVAEL